MSDTNTISEWGVGGSKPTHICQYIPDRGAVASSARGKKSTSTCLCGRMIVIDRKYFVEGSDSPKIVKYWYDIYGNLERVTGDK